MAGANIIMIAVASRLVAMGCARDKARISGFIDITLYSIVNDITDDIVADIRVPEAIGQKVVHVLITWFTF